MSQCCDKCHTATTVGSEWESGMKIALVQQVAQPDPIQNRERGTQALRQAAAQGASLVCFAELAFDRFFPQFPASPSLPPHTETLDGPTTQHFCNIAKELGVVVVLNLYESDGLDCYDCSPVIDADGRLLGRTRMLHIPHYPGFYEKDYYTPGDAQAMVYDTQVGRIGVAICYDRHYPEYMRALRLAGAELVVVPQAGAQGEWPEGLFEAEMQVASFQNGYFTALCNRVGEEGAMEFCGASFVCGPDGRIRSRAAKAAEEILVVELDLQETKTCPAARLFMQDRRPELYQHWFRIDKRG